MRNSGYTLIELMITVAILSIIIGVVVPGARSFVNHSLLSKEVNELSSLSRLARFKAMDEQSDVILCPTTDYAKCTTNWSYAKMAFIDLDDNGERGSDENILGATEILHSSVSVVAPSSTIVFDTRGGASLTTTLVFCDDTNQAENAVGLIINGYGKISIAQDSDNDNVKEDHNNSPLSCG